MNVSFFIAQRLIGKNEYRFSRPVIRIAITAIALSLTVMLMSLAIIKVFKTKLLTKLLVSVLIFK